MRGATMRGLDRVELAHISIHAPHAGRDVYEVERGEELVASFQSTRPMRGATHTQYSLEPVS